MKQSQRGQGVIEALLSFPILFLAGSAIVAVMYRGIVYYYADYQLHEALICTQFENPTECQNELENKISKILLTKTSFTVQLRKKTQIATGKVRIEFSPFLTVEKTF